MKCYILCFSLVRYESSSSQSVEKEELLRSEEAEERATDSPVPSLLWIMKGANS